MAKVRTREERTDGTDGNVERRDNGQRSQRPNPFTRASALHEEPMHDATHDLASTAVQAGPYDVPAYGHMRHIFLHVASDGNGAAGGTSAVAEADAPWSALGEITLSDVDGSPLVGPVSGYELYLLNKYGGYTHLVDPRQAPEFSAVDSDGEFSYGLRVPVEIARRDALGALPNMNTGQQFKVGYNVGPTTRLYSTAPGTAPKVRHRSTLEAWSPPPAADLRGRTNQQKPPGEGTAQYWTRHVAQVSSGHNVIQLPRLGNWLRNAIFVFRDSSGARSTSDLPDSLRVEWDGALVFERSRTYWRRSMAERYGLVAAEDAANGLDAGVLVWDHISDFDGKPGNEMRDSYLATTQGTRLELRGDFGAAGTLTILTNDVVPRSVESIYR